jgi:hypothetical protein
VHTRKIMIPVIPIQDFIGLRFGRLVVISFLGLRSAGSKNNRRFWECLCDCGEIVERHTNSLTSGNTKSCGCLRRERNASLPSRKTHGLRDSSEYTAWQQMLGRCHNTNHQAYRLYGARGILVCDRWQNSFENFIADMGRKPSAKHSLGRINNDLGYSPENCRWEDWFMQAQNRRGNRYITFNGQTKCLTQWERELGFTRGAIRCRLKSGMSIADALTKPRRNYPPSKYKL